MAVHSTGKDVAGTVAPAFVLDRREAIPKLIGRHEDFLIVTGLAGTSRDIAALTEDGAHTYSMAGAMGGACMIGLGLALARRDKRVLVVTGDGELLMNLGSLATIAVMNPPNLSVVCVDNGHYGETGYQKSHTSLGVDLEKIAAGSGIKRTLTIEQEPDIAAGARLIREGNASSFVLLRVKPTEPPSYKRDLDPATTRTRFRAANLGSGR
jgi:thiamine pyrophosphate-dependent acetolactate synthase large subunit-like protein